MDVRFIPERTSYPAPDLVGKGSPGASPHGRRSRLAGRRQGRGPGHGVRHRRPRRATGLQKARSRRLHRLGGPAGREDVPALKAGRSAFSRASGCNLHRLAWTAPSAAAPPLRSHDPTLCPCLQNRRQLNPRDRWSGSPCRWNVGNIAPVPLFLARRMGLLQLRDVTAIVSAALIDWTIGILILSQRSSSITSRFVRTLPVEIYSDCEAKKNAAAR